MGDCSEIQSKKDWQVRLYEMVRTLQVFGVIKVGNMPWFSEKLEQGVVLARWRLFYMFMFKPAHSIPPGISKLYENGFVS